MQVEKIGFFTRIKKSIFNFEEYEKFIEESPKKAFAYFFKLIAIFSIFVTIVLAYTLNINVKSIIKDMETEFPKFKVENNILNIDEKEEFEYYLEDYDIQLIMNENELNYIQNDYSNCLIMLKDKLVIKYSGIIEEIGYTDIGNISNKTIVDFFKTEEWKILYINICLVILVLNFILYSIIILLDVVTLSILGLIINNLIRTRFKYREIVKISIYAITLSVLLYLLYIVVNTLFGTTIKYFQIAYSTISYIYLITVMLMIKADIIKNTQELQKVLEEQKKVKEELERQKQEEKQKEKEKEEEEEKKERKEKDKGKAPQEPQTDNG